MQLNEIRKELRFNNELVQLIETLKNIAGSQYHLMEKEKRRFEEFMDAFSGFFRVVNLVTVEHPLVRATTDVLGMVIVTSDSGFMGGLNQGVIRAALRACGQRPPKELAFIVIGEKGASVLAGEIGDFKFFRGINQESIYEHAVEVKDYIVGEVLAGRIGRVMLAYPRPLSFTAQTIDVISVLPCGVLFDQEAESEVGRRTRGDRVLAEARKVIVESSFPDIVEYLASVWVTAKLYEVFEDSKLAEFSARAMHLEGSFQKLEKERKKIRGLYFKASHERIDKGMRESFSATKQKKQHKKKRTLAEAE